MDTSFRGNGFWERLVGQAFVLIGEWLILNTIDQS